MDGAGDDEPFPLSALQHHLFCPRQCALIHVERAWAENALTAEGKVAHEVVHTEGSGNRRGVRTVTGMPLRSRALGISGIADIVELHRTADGWQPFPVEHKRGKPKAHRADDVQLCAQAICLEEMFSRPVPRGALFYGKTKRRLEVGFDDELRTLTARAAAEVQAMLQEGRTPQAIYEARRCDTCSLLELCRPKTFGKARHVDRWLSRQIDALE